MSKVVKLVAVYTKHQQLNNTQELARLEEELGSMHDPTAADEEEPLGGAAPAPPPPPWTQDLSLADFQCTLGPECGSPALEAGPACVGPIQAHVKEEHH